MSCAIAEDLHGRAEPGARAWPTSDRLIADTAAAGVTAEVDVDGDGPAAPPGRRPVRLPHRAGGTDQRGPARRADLARVRISYRPSEVCIEVTDDGPRGGGPGPSSCRRRARADRDARAGRPVRRRTGRRGRARLASAVRATPPPDRASRDGLPAWTAR